MVNSWQFVFLQLTIRNHAFFEQTVPHFRFGPENHPEFVHFSRKKNFFSKVSHFFHFSKIPNLQSVTLKAEHTEHGEHTDYVITLILNLSPLTSALWRLDAVEGGFVDYGFVADYCGGQSVAIGGGID